MDSRRKYTEEQYDFIKNSINGRTYQELADVFNRHFCLNINSEQIRGVCRRLELKSGLPVNHTYTPEQIEFLKINADGRSRKELAEMFNMRFELHLGVKAIRRFCQRRKLNSTREFDKLDCKSRPIGSEMLIRGYARVKVSENPRKWRNKQAVIWETANGTIPSGHQIIFGDGNRNNFELSNLLLVSQKEIAILNNRKLIKNSADLTRAGITIAKVRLKINERLKKKPPTTAGGRLAQQKYFTIDKRHNQA